MNKSALFHWIMKHCRALIISLLIIEFGFITSSVKAQNISHIRIIKKSSIHRLIL